MSRTRITLIISTYNWHEALRLSLNSVKSQIQLPDEIIIADDGSGFQTENLISSFKNEIDIPLKHIWHEDCGFRLSAIRNKSIAAATSEYIVQIDHDMILSPYFIKDHSDFARANSLVRASRLHITEEISRKLLEERDLIVRPGVHTNNFFSSMRLPWLWPLFETNYKNKNEERYEIHGCNMAYWRHDAIKINGYDEEFEGWGYEDKDFVVRMLNAGVKKRFLKLGAIACHLFHLENSRHNADNNFVKFTQTIARGKKTCARGVSQYL